MRKKTRFDWSFDYKAIIITYRF